MPYSVYELACFESYADLLAAAEKNKFDMAAGPINPFEIPVEFDKEPTASKQNDFSYPDMALSPDQWHQKFIGTISEDIDCDSEDLQVRRNSEKVLSRDFDWVNHIQYNGMSMITLHSGDNTNLARCALANCKGQLLVRVPFYNPKLNQAALRRDISEEDLEEIQKVDTWNWWNNFRSTVDFNSRIKVALEFHESYEPNIKEVRRWLGEPVELLIIPKSLFIRNRHYFPVLKENWKRILYQFFLARANIMISSGISDDKINLRLDYLFQLSKGTNEKHTLNGYEDVLEIPLQPLYDNLDSYTYEVFENDPIKYRLYQQAIEAALIDRVPEAEKETKLSIVMLLGAGRGPLARACLNAAENTSRKIRLYIIEKNQNAIRTLKNLFSKLWSKKDVHLICKDMRDFKPPEKADIIVSELLGSFGDNELSPECLDSSLCLLKPNGISIPCKSTSFINPIMSSKLYNSVRSMEGYKTATLMKAAEAGYVVLLKNVYHIAKPKPLFEFVHPNYEKPINNNRYKYQKFDVTMDSVLTGIGGYFEAVLYKDIILSNNIESHTPGMCSWFGMYFPFTTPIQVKENQTIEIHFWRCCTPQKVWYEWSLTKPLTTHVHNHNGTSQPIYC